jgi:hypothetical protein
VFAQRYESLVGQRRTVVGDGSNVNRIGEWLAAVDAAIPSGRLVPVLLQNRLHALPDLLILDGAKHKRRSAR